MSDVCRVTYIYALYNPEDVDDERYPNVRYVGKSNDPRGRLQNHIRSAVNNPGGRHVWSWLAKLLRKDIEPGLLILECVPHDAWQEIEREWIEVYEDRGYNLTNMTAGGLGMLDMAEETRRKIREAAKWHHANNPEFHNKVIQNLGMTGGNKLPDDYEYTEEALQKISDSVKASWEGADERREEHSRRAKQMWKDGTFKRQPMSKETRKKISMTLRERSGVETSRAKLTQEQVNHIREVVEWEVRGEAGRRYFNIKVVQRLAKEYDVSVRTVKDCATYETYY